VSEVRSADGTTIAFEKSGQGPAIILVDGALCSRSFGPMRGLASLLAEGFAMYAYDRRGRGESGDTQPYSVEREVEDVDALVEEAGGSAYLFGSSSGGVLALEAARRLGGKVGKVAVWEAPCNDDPNARERMGEYSRRLAEALAEGRRGDAVELFMTLVGTPAEQIAGMRQAPFWAALEAVAPTLAYDSAVLGGDGALPLETAASVAAPALLMNGDAGFSFMSETADALAKAMPDARRRTLAGQRHDADPEPLAPVLAEFFRG
jgi:pimeloyl-ACP methyl ester carboxylesterase